MKKRNIPLLIGGSLLLIVALTLLLFAAPQSSQDAAESNITSAELPTSGPTPVVGDKALDFSLQDVNGNTVWLSDHLGNPIIVNFWASWCAPCRVEMPALQQTYEEYKDDGLVILALNQNETAETASAFFYNEMNLSFGTPLLDDEFQVAEKYGIRNLPTTYVIDPDGVVTAIHRGPAVKSQFENYLMEAVPLES